MLIYIPQLLDTYKIIRHRIPKPKHTASKICFLATGSREKPRVGFSDIRHSQATKPRWERSRPGLRVLAYRALVKSQSDMQVRRKSHVARGITDSMDNLRV